MLLKAMGFDPQICLTKAAELETLAKGVATELETRVKSIDERLAALERLTLLVLTKVDQQQGATVPAGDADLMVLAKERSNGRSTGSHRTAGKARKVAS